MIPKWLSSATVPSPCSCCRSGAGRRSFVDRTLSGIGGLFEVLFISNDLSQRAGLLQSIDPRVKVVLLLAGLVTSTLTQRAVVLSLLYALTLILALASLLPLGRFLAKTWLVIPLFTGVMLLPAIPRLGLAMACLLVFRTATAFSWGLLLLSTTRWDRLLRALGALGVPDTFLLILTLMLQNLQVLARDVREMQWALKSRLPHGIGTRTGQRVVATHAGALFRRSLIEAQDRYQAMLARGFDGKVQLSQ